MKRDWGIIKTAFLLHSDLSFRELAKKHGVAYRALRLVSG